MINIRRFQLCLDLLALRTEHATDAEIQIDGFHFAASSRGVGKGEIFLINKGNGEAHTIPAAWIHDAPERVAKIFGVAL